MSPVMSMTGFGQGENSSELGVFSIEMRSVNGRHLEVRVHLPRELTRLELPLARLAKARLGRGKVEVSVRWKPAPAYRARICFNKDLLLRYQAELVLLTTPLQREDRASFEYLLGLPGVAETETPPLEDEALMELASRTLDDALDALLVERRREGEVLAREIAKRADALDEYRRTIESRSEEVVEAYRKRLSRKAQEWSRMASVDIDSGRLEVEVLLFAERADIREELVRLGAHIEALRAALQSPGAAPRGKPIEFLTQELLRETNTIAGKARDSSIACTVLLMKNEIEKIREQTLNLE